MTGVLPLKTSFLGVVSAGLFSAFAMIASVSAQPAAASAFTGTINSVTISTT